ncbi:unnamed protein product [Allacma fusca]|nr:unnamed protein product [Allacma fusca]
MVRDVCTARGDAQNVDPEEIVQELYDKGLMKTVLDNVEWNDNMTKNLQEKVEAIAGTRPTSRSNDNDLLPPSMVPERLSKSNSGKDGENEDEESNVGSFESDIDSDEEKQESKANDNIPSQRVAAVVQEVPHFRPTAGRLNGKYFLKLDVLDGRNFLEQLFDSEQVLNESSNFILHVSYKTQRFYSKPTPARCDPKFQEGFMIDIGYFEAGSVLQLLAKYEPIHIILLQETATGERKLLSSCLVDWRSQLMSDKPSQKIPVTLMGIGPEFQVPVGILNSRMAIVPSLEEILSASTYAAQINAERSIQDEKERLFLIYVKQWWREFIEIRPQNSKRNVKIFSYDENTTPRPIQTFVKPIVADRLLLTPCHAAWFVSLITLLDNNSNGNYCLNFPSSTSPNQGSPQVLCSHWQSLITTLAAKSGRVEDHATLLCSLLLGFGLDAYVAIGNKNSGASWVWVITFEEENQVTFWESTNGKRFSHTSIPSAEILVDKLARLKNKTTTEEHGLNTISCLFNNCLLYANIQNTTFLDVVDWNLGNPSKWKKIPESTLKSSSKFNELAPNLMPPAKNPILVSADLEIQLKTVISEYRLTYNLHTTWDTALSRVLGQELARYELEASTGSHGLPGYFQAAVLKIIPGGYELKGYPWHGNVENNSQIFQSLKRNPKCQEIMLCRGNDVRFALRVQVFAYPEDVICVRLMIACRFVPTASSSSTVSECNKIKIIIFTPMRYPVDTHNPFIKHKETSYEPLCYSQLSQLRD